MQKDSERRDAGLGSPPRSLLLATDLSCRCDRALDRAVMLASAWGAKLHVLYVLEGNEPEQGPEPVPGGSVRALAERHLRAATRNHDVEAEIVIERGDPAEIILRTANELDCELIVTGIARSGNLARAVLGTTVERLVHRAPMPVLIVKMRPWRAYPTVVVASDFSETSAHALRQALSVFPDARMILAHAYRVPFEGFISRAAHEAELLADAERQRAAFLPSVGAPPDRLEQMEYLIRYGTAESVIGTHVWDNDIDLVVMGTHGRSGRFGILMGSTAERLLICLHCDVMIVREPRALSATIGAGGASAGPRLSGNG
ncbi:universal stress protein [Roseomonas eburnea]|uniref:Universal stress protein n=3 Tax=Acetobacterales TaxID=3120395 RepID=A0A9X9XI29_9PROT|nr:MULTISPECIES: universal stress protein [Neoroseomonas]MBR0683365.1 universal stress protein [Neoroseomonas eburnea]MBW6400365.1 universal stress protein [Neoroseomonas alba]